VRSIFPALLVCLSTVPAGSADPVRKNFQPKSMAYVLQADKLARKKADAVAKLAACGRDLIVLDYSHSGDAEGKWTGEQIRTIRAGKAGRKVVAYLSIGEAEDYRSYWQKGWDRNRDGRPDEGAPDFLCAVNPDWEGNYRVKYWKAQWQEILLRYVDEIVAQGFDGVYLDIVDAFETFEQDGKRWIDNRPNPETSSTYRKDMVRWVLRIAARARAKSPGFLVIPQNGSQLLAVPEYLQAVDAVGVEDLFTDGNRKQKAEDTNYRLGSLQKAVAAGKPVLVIEYGKSEKAKNISRSGASNSGLVLLLTDRQLKTLGSAGP